MMTKITLSQAICMMVLAGSAISLTAYGYSKHVEKHKKRPYQGLQVSFTAITTRTLKLKFGDSGHKIVLPSPKVKISIYGKHVTYKLNRCYIKAKPVAITGGLLLFLEGDLVCTHNKDKFTVLTSVLNVGDPKSGKPLVLKKYVTLRNKLVPSMTKILKYSLNHAQAGLKYATYHTLGLLRPKSIFYKNVTIKRGAQIKFFPF